MYIYIWIDCQSSILSHMVPELINNLICWNCKGCIGKSIGPVKYRFTILSLPPSLRAQRLVAGSFFLDPKKKEKNNANKLSQLHALEPARCAVITPANTYYGFVFSSHICLPAHSDVAGSIFSNSFFSFFVFVQKN